MFLKVFGLKFPKWLEVPKHGIDFVNKIFEAILHVGGYLYGFAISGGMCMWTFKPKIVYNMWGHRVFYQNLSTSSTSVVL